MANEERHILCIDLKSFFASCECVARNLDPFTTPLVVASNNKGAITLAVTPALKKYGIKGRTRIYDIPKNIKEANLGICQRKCLDAFQNRTVTYQNNEYVSICERYVLLFHLKIHHIIF